VNDSRVSRKYFEAAVESSERLNTFIPTLTMRQMEKDEKSCALDEGDLLLLDVCIAQKLNIRGIIAINCRILPFSLPACPPAREPWTG
jgi:hypothetical protein